MEKAVAFHSALGDSDGKRAGWGARGDAGRSSVCGVVSGDDGRRACEGGAGRHTGRGSGRRRLQITIDEEIRLHLAV